MGPPPSPPRKSRRGLLTCLVGAALLASLGAWAVFALMSFATQLIGSRPLAVIKTSNTVGLVQVRGIIADYNTEKILKTIEYYRKAKNIRAVLVRIDSGGGTVGGSQEIYEALKGLKKSGKVVVASMGDVAASGAYYVACAADEIFTNSGTLTGSIGVILSLPNLEGLAEKIGVKETVVKSGRFKDVPSLTRTLAEEERALLQGVIDDTHNQFVEAILEHREAQLTKALENLPQEESQVLEDLGPDATAERLLRRIADGRIMTGRQSVVYGLVDKVGAQAQALERLAEMAGIEEPEIYEYRPKRTLMDVLNASARSTLGKAAAPLQGPRLEYRLAF